jgi:hypothetical protein
LRASVTPRSSTACSVLLETPSPPPKRATLSVIVESSIVRFVPDVWLITNTPPPMSFAADPVALLASIRLDRMVTVVAPWMARPPPRVAWPPVIRTRSKVADAELSTRTFPPIVSDPLRTVRSRMTAAVVVMVRTRPICTGCRKVEFAPPPAIVTRVVFTLSAPLSEYVPGGTLIVSSAPVPFAWASSIAPRRVHSEASHWVVSAVELTWNTAAPADAGAARRPASSASTSACLGLIASLSPCSACRRAPGSCAS